MSITVDTGTKVTLHFSLALEDGELIDSNFDAQPATFIMGDGKLLPGFEAVLKGLKAGDQQEFSIAPEHAFGQRNPENIQSVAREHFQQEDLQLGAVFSFQNGDGELPGVVIDMDSEEVRVDFNHPLSGRTIIFRVDIIDIFPASVH
jgi:FKBP-type peptidyl-prolyl cis-trans isomerase SlpA